MLLDAGLITVQENLTAASNKHGNVRAEPLQGRSACATREASPACLFAEERRGNI